MQEEKLNQVALRILKKNSESNDIKTTNQMVFKIWKEMGYNIIADPDHLVEMPSCEAVTRVIRKIKEENPNLKGSEKEISRREDLRNEYKEKFSSRCRVEKTTTSGMYVGW